MGIAELKIVLKVFRGDKLSLEEASDLVKEVLLMTLARATRSDTHIAPIEVRAVQRFILHATGEDLSEADVRIAASAHLFESISLESALAKVSSSLTSENRVFIAQGLAEVIVSDLRISELELDFFDSVAKALSIRPSELAGLRIT